MDQTTTQTDNSSDTAARPSFDKVPPLSPVPPLGSGADAFPAPVFPGAPEPAGATAPSAGPTAPTRLPFRLERSRTDRMLGGVCGGLAQSLGVDVALLRIGLVALTVLGAGIGAVLYVAAWILAPEADTV